VKPKLLLLAILLLGLFLRTYHLADFPSGFTPDEASFGYDAYSLLETGKDHWGQSWPLTFRSFGDFKLPLYGYLTIPSVAIFGLNEFAVRLPSALFGTLAIFATYLLTKQLFSKSTPEKPPRLKASPDSSDLLSTLGANSLELLTAFLLAISPWHISLSRVAIEANLTSFFLPLGLFFLLKGLNNKSPGFWILDSGFCLAISGLLLGLNMYTYHAARLFTPLILIATLIWHFSSTTRPSRKIPRSTLMIYIIRVLPLLVIFTLFTIPIFFTFFSQSASRISDTRPPLQQQSRLSHRTLHRELLILLLSTISTHSRR
jgi:4-amino-4-deoxy-L-arabinose transferase-like glycosyltransferase